MQAGPKQVVSANTRRFHMVPNRPSPIRFTAPIIVGRSLIEGRTEPTFPAFFRAQIEPVTFRNARLDLPRETVEEIYLLFVARVLADRRTMAVLVSRHISDAFEEQPFWTGLTLIEHDDELFSFQRVVFPRLEAVPKGGCDQGGIYEVPVDRLSAWDGLTTEQSRQRAA